ncbi:MAG: hypothetical protein ACK45Y_07340 [Betaproteobacteria bacterium]|nr:hypothetical protein AEM42_04815 [Betaproteobacteria bacterium UKL13-2]HCG53870.1 hypothetical protein [Betaproteobacteria bacterium]
MTFIEGLILHHFNLSVLKFETAGSRHNAAANMELTNIIDAQDSTLAVLQRIEAKFEAITTHHINHSSPVGLTPAVEDEGKRIRKSPIDGHFQAKCRGNARQ